MIVVVVVVVIEMKLLHLPPPPFAQPIVHFQGLPLFLPELDSSIGRLGKIPTTPLDLRISATSASEPGLYSHSAVLIYHHRPKK